MSKVLVLYYSSSVSPLFRRYQSIRASSLSQPVANRRRYTQGRAHGRRPLRHGDRSRTDRPDDGGDRRKPRADHPASGSSVACQANVVALSRTTNPDRIAENLTEFNFELGEDEMATIQTLARPDSRIVNPAGLASDWDAC